MRRDVLVTAQLRSLEACVKGVGYVGLAAPDAEV
jgi:hypothetical protein